MKLLIQGGSIAAGFGVKKSYFTILEEEKDLGGFELLNVSQKGSTTFDAIWSFEENIYIHKPDILLLHYAIDDAYYPVYRSEFKENLVQIIRLSRKSFNPVILLATSHPFENSYEMNMIYIYYRTIREVAVDLGCTLIPVHTFWAGFIEERNSALHEYTQNDYRYPNEKGHRIYSEVILNHLKRLLKEK